MLVYLVWSVAVVFLRRHGSDRLDLSFGRWNAGECVRHLCHQESPVPPDSPDDPHGPAGGNLEALGVCGLRSQQGNRRHFQYAPVNLIPHSGIHNIHCGAFIRDKALLARDKAIHYAHQVNPIYLKHASGLILHVSLEVNAIPGNISTYPCKC